MAEAGVAPSTPVFVDKMPLNSVFLPLIAKLFPAAKIILALRDPRDVVLSCFRRRFAMNPGMYEFTTLETTAAYYVAVMRLIAVYRGKLALDCAETRHESLVADFEGEARRLCDFLGLSWATRCARFARRAPEPQNIDTPSSAQVARGLSDAGLAQWRRYAAATRACSSRAGAVCGASSAIRRVRCPVLPIRAARRATPAATGLPVLPSASCGSARRCAMPWPKCLRAMKSAIPIWTAFRSPSPRSSRRPTCAMPRSIASPWAARTPKQIVAALNRHKGFLRGEMGHLITMKFTPELRFVEDESFAEAAEDRRPFSSPNVSAAIIAADAGDDEEADE